MATRTSDKYMLRVGPKVGKMLTDRYGDNWKEASKAILTLATLNPQQLPMAPAPAIPAGVEADQIEIEIEIDESIRDGEFSEFALSFD